MSATRKHMSYSALSTWQECGWKYYLTRIEGVKEGHAVWFTGGTAVHLATEYYDKAGDLSLDHAYLDEVWNKAWFETVAIDEEAHGDMQHWKYAKREDMSWWYGEGRMMLENWAKLRNKGWSVYEDFVEKEYDIEIEDTSVKMAIDRVMTDFDGNRVLVDIKTGATSQKHPLQLAVYAWALQKHGVTVDKAGFWEARTGSFTMWSLEHLHSERIEDIFHMFDVARQNSVFMPNLSNCSRCDVISSCKWLHN